MLRRVYYSHTYHVIRRLLVPLRSCRMEFVLVLTFYIAPTINCYEVYVDLSLPCPDQPTAQGQNEEDCSPGTRILP